jgi:hypothetical protein
MNEDETGVILESKVFQSGKNTNSVKEHPYLTFGLNQQYSCEEFVLNKKLTKFKNNFFPMSPILGTSITPKSDMENHPYIPWETFQQKFKE